MKLLLLLLIIGITVWATQQLIERFGFRNLEYHLRFTADEVSEGDTVELIETIISRKPVPLPWVKAELTTDASLLFACAQSSVSEETRFVSSCFCLFPYKKIERHWHVVCTKRGMFTVSHAVLVISDLFGTAEWSKPLPDTVVYLTVLPAVRRLDQLTELPQQFGGEIVRRRTVIPDRYAVCGIREYADGDPVRDICWTASARSVSPMVWQYQETASPEFTLLLNLETRITDRDRLSDRALFEDEIRLCAALLGSAAQLHLPVRLLANTEIDGMPAESRTSGGADHLPKLLRMLAAMQDTISCKFTRMLRRYLAENQNSAAIVLTPFVSEELMQIARSDTRITVLSLKPLPETVYSANIRHITLQQERKSAS
ncbi:MAG: DUF58 domain-containing protein [Oscillospiraceae bacterium]|nr:DUF58 domain-containing protein [Oscillospiraceae bacterium]